MIRNNNSPKTYVNVMEELVQEEIQRQLKTYSRQLTQSINTIEVATFALNRLPALYASSEKGKNQQKLNGQKKYQEQIKTSVRQGFAAVHRDPIRSSTPLVAITEVKYLQAESALEELEQYLEIQGLNYQKLSWHNLVTSVQRAIHKISSSRVNTVNSVMYDDDDSEPTLGSAVARQQKNIDWNARYVHPTSKASRFG
ncbi:MAG: hypothetical protein N5P05_002285 [Chroococcopsis gigantea SAG 12.99]|jgi:hypothetical protein|nr:late competence development ComFB family protein [Chlorogloea purpurea SAG 13.99]MDV3000679.1 hypothetical protein [Chroococcopsis gigantea SAG 12.99]